MCVCVRAPAPAPGVAADPCVGLVWAGHPEHEYTSGYCKASALDWILGRATLNDFVKGRAAAAPAASGDDDDDM